MKHIKEALQNPLSKLVKSAKKANTPESLEFVDCVERLQEEKKRKNILHNSAKSVV